MTRTRKDFLVVLFALLGLLLLYLISNWQYSGELVNKIDKPVEKMLKTEFYVAIALFSLLIFLNLFYIPKKFGKLNQAAYVKGIGFALLSNFIFFFLNKVFTNIENQFGITLVIVSYVFLSLIFFIIINYISKIASSKSSAFRTRISASIAGGILFTLLIEILNKLIEIKML